MWYQSGDTGLQRVEDVHKEPGVVKYVWLHSQDIAAMVGDPGELLEISRQAALSQQVV